MSREDWEQNPRRSLQRGLTSAATALPVWFLQRGDSRVDHWPIIGDYRPIFTQHVEEQFSWMAIHPAQADWMQEYLRNSGLVFSAAVVQRYEKPENPSS